MRFRAYTPDFIKYCVVSCVSFGADYLLTLLLLRLTVPQVAALGIGAVAGCVIGYAGLEFWAFRRKTSALDIRRFFLYCLGVLVLFLARAGCLELLSPAAGPGPLGWQALALAIAYFVAFWVNYFFQAFVVFHVRKRM